MPAVDDLKSLDRLDQVVLGAGVLGLIVSLFFPYWGSSFHGLGGVSAGGSINAWHGYAVLGMLFILAATALAAVRVLAPASLPNLPIGANLLTVVLLGLGTFLVILRGFTYPHASFPGGSYGVKWGGYLLFLILVVQFVAAFLQFRKSGEGMPDFSAKSAGSTAPGSVPPPPPVATYPPSTNTMADLPPVAPVGDHSHDHPHDIPPAP